MTVVARLEVDDYPLLIGDILLSGQQKPLSLVIPTIGKAIEDGPKTTPYTPTGLRQKIVLIGPHLAVGWSGSRMAARHVIQELIDRNLEEPFTVSALLRCLEKTCATSESGWLDDLGLVGYVIEPSGAIASFGFRYNALETSAFGQIGLIGSGTDDFERLLKTIQKPTPPSVPLNSLEYAVAIGLMVSGQCMSAEVTTKASLAKLYGGGYEVASLVSGQFEKMGDITYVFWEGSIVGDKILVKPLRVCKYSYVNDVLLIRTTDAPGVSKPAPPVLHVVGPVYRDLTRVEQAEFRPPDFNSTFVCNYFFVNQVQGGCGVYCNVGYFPSGNPPVKFTETGTTFGMSFDVEQFKTIFKRMVKSAG